MFKYFIAVVIAMSLTLNQFNFFSVNKPSEKLITMAINAWRYEKHLNPTLKPIVTIIDYSQPSNVRRLFVIDITTGKILYSEFVAHGINSGSGAYAKSFSNTINSKKSNIGVLITGETYIGKHGLSLRLHGKEPGFNTNAYTRSIVIHGSKYVNKNYVGHSWGCPALDQAISSKIIDLIKNNSLIFAYYPDSIWLHTSKYLGN
jgi:hypothetical protein